MVTMLDIAMGVVVATNNDNAVGVVVPLSTTEDKDAYIGALVVFKGACVGAFVDGAGKSAAGKGSSGGSGSLAPWCTRTLLAPIDLIIAGNGIVATINIVVVVVSRNVAAEGGSAGPSPPLSFSLLTLTEAAVYLIPPLNVHR